ncbi:MAG TPA: hypothetical protein VGT44_05720, partial [Ktedonobacteraceae bacterium]|nr:hypothetical protein [Ktedonobacteraceae bacterium]
MKLNNFWGTTRSPGLQVGMIVRLGLALTAIAGSIALAWVLLGGHYDAHAGAINTLGTADQPMGLVIDKNGNAWVAEPNCNPAPVCSAPAAGAIEEFKLNGTSGISHVATYLAPQLYNPTFLTVDASGNIWFTDPTNNAIGKLVPGAHPTWAKYTTGLSASAEPFGIITDKNGKIWFAERGISKIGFIDPTAGTPTIHENGGFTTNSQPFGLTMDNTGNIWFTEDTVANLGTFTPTTNGTVTIHEHPTGTGANLLPAHMISADKTGNLWYSEGGTDLVGEYTISGGAT